MVSSSKSVTALFLSLIVILCDANPIKINANLPSTRIENEEYRLNNEVIPENYNVKLTLLEDFGVKAAFTGEVTITIKPTVDATQKDISLHLGNLKNAVDTLVLKDSNDLDVHAGIIIVQDADIIKITPNRPLRVTETLTIKSTFEGVLGDDMYGFYRSSYNDEQGVQWIATTQFQPTHARRAFPCFDEPNLKATFDIAITHPADFHALGNTEGTRSTPAADNQVTTTFKRTPKMSSYLIAFIVSKFASMSVQLDTLANGVWSRKETVATGKYGFDMAPKLLKSMEDFTGVPYSASGLTKLDQVAIPDFAAGAMENWGLVTYRETALLWDPLESTARSKQRVGTVVAHELAHMWFGNLITTDWWDTTWLNEGFARFFEYHATAMVETDWQLDSQFVVEQHQAIMNTDSFLGAQALTSDAFTPTQISNKFGSITYSKGGSVIRMMQHFLGTTKFYSGIKAYIGGANKHFSNRKPADLFTAMQEQVTSPLPATIQVIMNGWTTKSGFPVVTVTSNNNGISLSQEQFLFAGKSETPKYWNVPISYATAIQPDFDNTTPKLWLPASETQTNVPDVLPTQQSWVILNVKSTGYYRVNYDDRLWNNIIAALNTPLHGNIHELNRAQLVDDAMNLARASHITYERAFDVLSYLENEVSYYPWYPAFNALTYLRRRFPSGSELDNQLSIFIRNLMSSLNENVSQNFNSRNQVEIHKKVLALSWACQLGGEECIETARTSFDDLKKGIPVNPDLRSTVYCWAAKESANNWNYLWTMYTETQLASEATLILSALGCTEDATLLNNYLQKSITDGSGIRKQDAQSVFTAVISGNRRGVDLGLTFLIEHSNDIIEHYGAMGALTSVVTGIADRLTSTQQITRLQNFLDASTDENFKEAAQLAINNAKANVQWAQDKEGQIVSYLQEKNGANTTPGGSSSPTPPSSDNPSPSVPPPQSTTPSSSTSIAVSVVTLISSILLARL